MDEISYLMRVGSVPRQRPRIPSFAITLRVIPTMPKVCLQNSMNPCNTSRRGRFLPLVGRAVALLQPGFQEIDCSSR